MEERDDKADQLADDALLAIMRLLVHQEGGMVVGVAEGEPYDCFDERNVGLVEQTIAKYRRTLKAYDASDPTGRMMLEQDVEVLRLLLDGQWNILRMALPAIIREMERRSPEEAPEDGAETPPLGLE